jgi:hypothetical protein
MNDLLSTKGGIKSAAGITIAAFSIINANALCSTLEKARLLVTIEAEAGVTTTFITVRSIRVLANTALVACNARRKTFDTACVNLRRATSHVVGAERRGRRGAFGALRGVGNQLECTITNSQRKWRRARCMDYKVLFSDRDFELRTKLS